MTLPFSLAWLSVCVAPDPSLFCRWGGGQSWEVKPCVFLLFEDLIGSDVVAFPDTCRENAVLPLYLSFVFFTRPFPFARDSTALPPGNRCGQALPTFRSSLASKKKK
eukprot:RCo011971